MKLIALISLSVAALALTSCNTVRGIGNGVQNVGSGIGEDLREASR